MQRNRYAIVFLLFVFMPALGGCQKTIKPAQFTYQSSALRGGQHTFAVYNDQHRLISDPLSELYEETGSKDISDVYVISHGWNFTLDEAYGNYHNYMELLDRHLPALQAQDPTFKPYFIFVVWPSVVRPLGDIAHALLPFGLDSAIAPFTSPVDSAIFHIPSGWKESLNAFSIALGTRYPIDYEKGLRDLGQKSLDIKGVDEDRDSDERWLAPPYCGPEERRNTMRRANENEPFRFIYDYYRVDSGGLMGRECPLSTLVYHVLRWRTPERSRTKIHLVGHSYGAKVVTLAGMEAIRLQRTIGQSKETEQRATAGDPLPPEQSIASLVLFNPAFHPRELHYSLRLPSLISLLQLDRGLSDEVELLQAIPRKAILYSSRDYATGRLFDLSQLVFSNELAQWYQVMTDTSYGFLGTSFIGRLYSGSVTFTGSVLAGVYSWSKTKLGNIPHDLILHSRQDDFYGFDWSKGDSSTIPRTFLNAIDYWMPLGRVITNADADKMGILRTAIPALGSIGMNRLVAERWYTPNEVHINELIGKNTDRRPGDQIGHNFCKVAGFLAPLNEEFDPHHFYSYDATSVMDTWYPGAGSHGDVRNTDPPKEGHCANRDISTPNAPLLEKRQYMFNFTYNFTRTPPAALQTGLSDR